MRFALLLLIAVMMIGVAGCQVSKPYIKMEDRVDQNIEAGNRGYLMGNPPPAEDRSSLKRPFMNVDIDFPVISGEKTKETKIVKQGGAGSDTGRDIPTREEQIK